VVTNAWAADGNRGLAPNDVATCRGGSRPFVKGFDCFAFGVGSVCGGLAGMFAAVCAVHGWRQLSYRRQRSTERDARAVRRAFPYSGRTQDTLRRIGRRLVSALVNPAAAVCTV
jgi:hypothetical protein